jgi:hypothetical protein
MKYNRCITFDKEAQGSLPQHINDKMKAAKEAVQNSKKSYLCINCKHTNVFNRKPSKPVCDNIAGYCKNCGHVVWLS